MDAKSTLLDFLLSFRTPEKAAAMFAEDGVFEIPYLASVGIQPRYVGRQEIAGFIGYVLQLYPDWEYHEDEFTLVIDTPERAFAEYVVHPTAAATGRRINHLFMGAVHVSNGEIRHLREALNTVAAAQALLLGGVADLGRPGDVVDSF